jgi:hypothetical protein
MYCINHPDRETLVSCGKCGQPICTECAIRHPVGLRCPQCARLKKVPTYDVPAPYYLRALGAGLGTSVVCGVVVQILPLFVPIFFVSFFAALAAGAIVAEAIGRVTRQKRGRGLQIVAGVCVVVGYILGTFLIATFRFGPGAWLLLPVSLLNPFYWVYPVVAVAVAVTRLR